jgi:hypothetical protein
MARIAMRGDGDTMRACGGGAVDSIIGDRIEVSVCVCVSVCDLRDDVVRDT